MAFGAALVIIQAAVGTVVGGGSRSASDWAVTVAGGVGGPTLLAAFADYVLRRYAGLGLPDGGFPRSSLGLRAGERAVWTGRARARWPLSTWWLAFLLGLGVLDRDLITQLIFVGVVVVIALRWLYLGAGDGGRARGHGRLRCARAAADADPAAQDRLRRGGGARESYSPDHGQPAQCSVTCRSCCGAGPRCG